MTINSSENLASAVHQQKLDLAVVMLPVQPFYSIKPFPMLHEELVFAISSNHPLSLQNMIEPRKLRTAPDRLLPRIGYPGRTEQVFAAMGVTPRITMEMEDIEAI